MKKTLRVPFTRTLITLDQIRKTITRGQLVALFVFLGLAAAVVSSTSSAVSKKPASESKGTSSAGMRGLDLRPSRLATDGRSKLTVRSAIEDQPTITTDKTSYLPGETIVFTGTSWAAGEAITIAINADGISEGIQLQATADDAGSFTTTTIMPDSQPASVMKASAAKADASANASAQSADAGLFTATATGASGATAQAQFRLAQDGDEEEAYDPDLPGFLVGKIDKEDYLRRREEHINKLRGVFPGRPFDPSWRGQAIRDMNQKEGRANNSSSTFDSGSNKSSSTNGPTSDLLSGPNTPSSSTTWSSIGPSPLPNGQTFNTNNIPVSGRISAIAIHPTNSSIAYAGAAQGGVYRTLDGGATWTPIFDNAQTLAIGSIAIAPSQPSTIYVGTGEENFSCDTFFGVGVYRIDNADGASPTLSGPFNKDGTGADQMSGRAIGKVIVHPTNPDIIFVATGSGIGGLNCSGIPGVDTSATSLRPRGLWRSSNATSANPTFDRMTVATDNGGNRSVTDIEFEPGNPNILFTTVLGFSTAGSGGVFYSTNPYVANPTFTRTLATSSTSTSERVEISLNKTGSTIFVYAATSQSSGTFKRGTYTAGTPSGLSWTGSIGTAGFCGGQCTYDMPIAVDPTNANIVYLGGPGDSSPAHILTKVTNATATPTFTASQTGLHADEHAIEIDPSNNNTIWTGNDGGIWKSTNAAASWTSLNNAGFVATQFQSIAVHSTDANFTIGGTQDNGTECQGPCGTFTGNTWNQADYGDGGFALIDQSQSSLTTLNLYHTYYNQTNTLIGYAYVTSTANAKFVSSPTSDSWSFNGTGGVASCTGGGGYACTEAVEFYMPMAVGPGSPNPIYTGTDQLHRAATPGATNTSVSQVFVSGVPISAVGISPQNDQVRIVGLETGRVFRTMTGQTSGWPEVTGTIPQASTNYISRAVIDPNNQNTAYITMSVYFGDSTAHVYKTTNLNAGTPTWTGIGGGQIPDIPINAFVVDPSNSSFLYAGTDIGVYRSTDGGATWSPFSNGLPRVAVFDMAIQNSNRILRIATHGRGMWEISIGAIGNLQGTITNANTSSPISGATVTAGANSTTTNGSGFYQFTGIPVGTYSVSASAAGYTTNSVAGVNVTDGGTTTQNIALTPAPTTGCFTDTSQTDFQAGTPTSVDLTSSPGSVRLAAGAAAIDQQQTNTGNAQGLSVNTTIWTGNTFTPAVSGQLSQLDASFFNLANLSGGSVVVEIRTVSGTLPTSTVLATATFSISGTTSGFYSATFSSPTTLTAGTRYAYVAHTTAGSCAMHRRSNGATDYVNGNAVQSTNSGGSWALNDPDVAFKTYMSTGFNTSGDLVSSVKDSNPAVGATPNWTTLSWTGTTPASTTLKFQAAGSNSASGPFNFVGPDGTSATFFTTSGASLSQFNGNRYLKYKAYLSTSNSANTPTLNDATVCFNNVATQAATSLAVSSATGTYTGTANLSATLTSSSSPVSGKTITFTLNGNSVGSAVTNASGVASLSSVSLSGINAGSYPSGVGATFAGDTGYNASNGTASLTVNKASSTTTVDCTAGAPFTYTGSAITPCTATATGAGGLNVSVTPVNYTNNVNAGAATASATYGGDANHNGSTGNGGFTIDKASSTTTIDCTAGAPFTYTGSAITPCTATATGAGGLNVSVTPVNYTNNINAGAATASATYGGDANHNGSTGNGGFTIDKASSTTTIDCTAGSPFTYTGSAITPCTATATGAGGLNVSLTPVNYTNNVNAGAATASATYGGDANHNGSTGNGGFTINKASSTTTVDCTAGAPFTYTGSAITPCTATATGAGGLNVSVTPVNYTNNINAGAATASATYGGDANHNGSTGNGGFTINKASSTTTIDCTAGAPFTYTGSAITPCTATATGAGGLNVSVTPVNYTNNINAGAATASATYGGDANHDGSTGNGGFTIDKASSATTVTCGAGPFTYNGSAQTPCSASVIGAGGLSETLTVNYANNVNAGTATASASYGGDDNHTGSSDSKNFTIDKATATILVTGFTGPYDGNPHGVVSSSATGVNSEPLTGLVVDPTTYINVPGGLVHWSFTNANYGDQEGNATVSIGQAASMTVVTCPATAPTYTGSAITPCSVSVTGANLSLSPDPDYANNINAGTDTASASYTYPGDLNHTGSSDSKTFSIAKAPSTTVVTCGPGPFTYNGSPQTPCTANVTGAGGLSEPLTVNYADNTNAGTATASATYAGDPNHDGSNDSKNFNIGKATATIVVTGFNGSYDGNPHGVVSSSAIGVNSESLSGLVIDPTTYTNVPGGLVHWSFTNPNYGDQNGDATVTITKANQYITFGAIDDKTFGNADFGINATSSSGLTVNLAVASGPCTLDSPTSPSNVHINGAGNCTIKASQPGNGNYNAATDKNRSFSIAKASQTITFNALAGKTYGDSDFTVSATGGGSGNPITFSASGKCTVSGSTVHITGAGSCQITAAQAGNDNYNPAPDVARSFNIAKAASTTSVTCPSSVIYTGSAQMPCSASVTGFGGLNQPLTVYYANNVNAGTATASASYGGDADHNGSSDSKTFLIVSAGSITTVASSKNPSTFGDSISFTATLSPNTATGTVQFKIDGTNFGSPVTVVNGSATSGSTSSLTAGSHSISAVYSGDSNYTGSTGNLTQVVARPVKINGGGSLSQVIHFGFNVKPVQDDTSARGFKGHVEFHDLGLTGSADDLKFKSTAINGEYALDNHHGTFTGAGTLNGVSGYLFTATIEDNARKGAGNDKFRIQITNPGNGFNYDSNARAVNADGTIIAGKIKIHYDKDDFNTSSLEGNGSFLAGSLNFDIDVQTDGLGGYNAGPGVQFTDSTNSYTLTSVSIDTMKIGGIVTITGPALLNGDPGYKFQTDWDTGKLTLHLRLWDSAGKQVYDSKPSQLTSGSCAFIASN